MISVPAPAGRVSRISDDPTSLALGVAGGVAAGLLVSYFVFFKKPGSPKVQVVQRDDVTGQLRREDRHCSGLESSKREMRTLILERDLLSVARSPRSTRPRATAR